MKQELEQAAEAYSAKRVGGIILDDDVNAFKAGAEWQTEQKPVKSKPKWTELTWEDINTLENLMNNVHYEFRNGISAKGFGLEVLERFRETKGDEYLDEEEQFEKTELEQAAVDEEMISSIEQWLHEEKPEYVEKELVWLESLLQRLKQKKQKANSLGRMSSR